MAADHSLYAQAAVGDALYDLLGKALGYPVHQLIGGRLRESIQVGVALGIDASPEAMIDQAEAARAAGYRHLRIKIGLDARRDVENLRRLRDHFGDDVILGADANGGMSFSQALPLLKTLERFGLDIVEQPVSEWDISGHAALSVAVAISISADESVSTDHSRIEILRRRAATIIRTKTAKTAASIAPARYGRSPGRRASAYFPATTPEPASPPRRSRISRRPGQALNHPLISTMQISH